MLFERTTESNLFLQQRSMYNCVKERRRLLQLISKLVMQPVEPGMLGGPTVLVFVPSSPNVRIFLVNLKFHIF